MAEPTTKAELLTMMQEGYTAFEALLNPLSAEQLTTAGASEDWSLKDILAHLATWQGRAAQVLEALQRGEQPQLHPVIKTDEEMHHFNNATVAANRSRPLAAIQHEFRSTYQRIYASAEAFSEDELFDPKRLAWDGQALWTIAEGDTSGHYSQHVPTIEAWVAHQRA